MSGIALAQLGEIADLQAGVGFPVDLQGRSSGDYPVAKVGDISRVGRSGEAVISAADHYVEEGDLARLRARPIPPGSVLFAKIGEAIRHNHRVIAGCALLVDNNAMAAIPTRRVESRYLYHFLRSVDFYRLTSATTVPALRKSELECLSVPLPPLPEQRRIAEILDKADALRAKRRAALAQLDTLTQSIFLHMFGDPATNPMGWEVHRLADVFWLQEGPGVRNWQFKESGIKLLNVSNILKSGELDLSKTDRHLSIDEVQEKYSHFLVDAGDLVIASSGISIDGDDLLRTRSAFVRDEHLPLCMNTSTVRFKATHGVSDLQFLQQWLQSHEFRRQITREVTGSAQKNFGPTHLKRLRITLPPFDLLCRFAAIVESVEQQMASQRAHLAEFDTLFASLQHRAFRGEL